MREDSEEVIISRIWDNHGKEVGYEQKGVLVRCKTCKYAMTQDCPMDEVYADDYCSYGERKDNE